MAEREIEEQKEDMKRVLNFALEAGRILLKNGAEIFRVEETIDHICRSFHIENVDAFVMSNGIFITGGNSGTEVFAKVKHVPLSGYHLGIVTEVNDLSRAISAGYVNLDEAYERLRVIDHTPPKRGRFRVLAAGIGSGSFCYLLQGNLWESLFTVLIGICLFLFILFAEKHNLSGIVTNIIGGAFITILALLVTRLPIPLMLRLDKLIIGSILPMFSGVAFINAIRDIANSDFLSGTVRMIDALLTFVYIAIGVGTILSFYERMLGGLLR